MSRNHLKPLALALAVAAALAPVLALAASKPVVLDESKLVQTPRFDAKDLDPATPICTCRIRSAGAPVSSRSRATASTTAVTGSVVR